MGLVSWVVVVTTETSKLDTKPEDEGLELWEAAVGTGEVVDEFGASTLFVVE